MKDLRGPKDLTINDIESMSEEYPQRDTTSRILPPPHTCSLLVELRDLDSIADPRFFAGPYRCLPPQEETKPHYMESLVSKLEALLRAPIRHLRHYEELRVNKLSRCGCGSTLLRRVSPTPATPRESRISTSPYTPTATSRGWKISKGSGNFLPSNANARPNF